MKDPVEKQVGPAFPENRSAGAWREENLLLAKAVTGDRPSLYTLGMVAAKALEQGGVAVLGVDVRGVVHLLPPGAVQVLQRPLVPDVDLDGLDEEEAIRLMLAEGRSEEDIVRYLKGRDERN